MKLIATVFSLLFFVLVLHAQQKVINLYNGKAPGSESWDWQEKETSGDGAAKLVYNVVNPTLTVFAPDVADANGTAVVICPGGGFHFLAINHEGYDVARWLVRRGVTCFVLKYRVARCLTDDPGKELSELMTTNLKKFNEDNKTAIPMGIADAKAAITYVRSHAADFNIKPDQIGIMGFSAGGTLTESTAFGYTADNKPNFIAPIYAYVPPGQNTDVASDAPPMFLSAASDDNLHLVPSSDLLYNKWLAAGKPVEMHLYAKGGHGFGMRKQNIPTDNWIDRFGDWLQQQGFI